MADSNTRCETCRWWEPPSTRPGLHECLSPRVAEAVSGQFVATYRHEECEFHEIPELAHG